MVRVSCCSTKMLLLSAVVAIALLITSVTQTSGSLTNKPDSLTNLPTPKVRVTVYLESLCIDASNFFAQQLQPTYSKLSDIMELEFVPFGKAIATPSMENDRVEITFMCQHNAIECIGNRIMSCAKSLHPSNTQYELFACMMAKMAAKEHPVSAGQKCSEKLRLDWPMIASCTSGRRGAELLYWEGYKTAALNPPLTFVPTITINGVYDKASNDASLNSLLQQVCRAYGAYHRNCPTSPPPTPPPATTTTSPPCLCFIPRITPCCYFG